MNITWLGHSCFLIDDNGFKILIDPFVSSKFPKEFLPKIVHVNCVLVTHGHSDHLGDIIKIYDNKDTAIVCNFEIANFLSQIGNFKTIAMNLGGTTILENAEITMVTAKHSSSIMHNGEIIYGGSPCGFIIKIGNKSIYHFGDTDIFLDMKLINDFYSPKIGILPIGGVFTMDIEAAAYACNNFFDFDFVVPMHFDTFPQIKADTKRLAQLAKSPVKSLNPGECWELS